MPTLKPGDSVVMDSLSCHKRSGVRAAIEGVGCQLGFLPPYSPELNPIEHAFSKRKAKLRAAAKRTVEALWRYLGEVLDECSPSECHHFFTCGGDSAATASQKPL